MAVAASGCSVLVAGETGTGKELFARAIHEASGRALGPFVAVNCGAIPAELVGSELFGHERGAFTGALVERDGVFVQADGGTLFLDELGELPRALQPHLLRALETRRVQRIGGNRDRAVDIRLVAATNRAELDGPSSPLRPDLYHRIATVVIELPPLRARRDDVARLVDSFLTELEPEFGTRTVDPEIVRLLAEQEWPGNVRELRHAVHRAVALSARELRLEDLLPYRRCTPRAGAGAGAREASPAWPLPLPPPPAGTAPPDPMTAFDSALRQVLLAAYHQHGSMRRAAAALGIPRSTFADRARRLRIR
jgi:transcriptional regulator with GAF, ATPase, and Fis domain